MLHLSIIRFLWQDIPLCTYFIALSLLANLLVYRKPVISHLRLFSLLLLTLIIEIYGSYLSDIGRIMYRSITFFLLLSFAII